ncbi:tyrosine-protein kinase-like [Cynara cardunculus var. scolymus]|uniref:tyrosine-protein kinase-like n=1 Tax=Cynara cardunculus var. scolymus TaxID=59895 RepID=UPI000D622F7A|nr:tyrosine-protein kinase-like [Cynara cardunculus var. scolymus]
MEINTQKKGRPLVEELFKRIQDLEDGHARLKQKMLNLMISGDWQTSNLVPRQSTVAGATAALSSFRYCLSLMRGIFRVGVDYSNDDHSNSSVKHDGAAWDGGRVTPYSAVKLTEAQYFNILQSIDEPIHISNDKDCIIYRNRAWENFYGYTAAETHGKAITDFVIEPEDASIAVDILQEMMKGESWSGEFPVRNKRGERFLVFGSNKPFHDENGTIIGIICVSTAPHPYQELRPGPSVSAPERIASKKHGLDPQQPLQNAIASKISDLASKVKSKIKTRKNNIDHDGRSEDNHYSNITPSDYKQQSQSEIFSSIGNDFIGEPTTDSSGGNENRPRIRKVLSLKADAWMGRKGILWPWKRNGSEEDTCDKRTVRFGWPWLHYDQKQEPGPRMSYRASMKVENEVYESASASNTNEASGSRFSSSDASSLGSTNTNSVTKVDNLDAEIVWDDLIIKEQIGQGSCGTVYHALWDGSDVAVKVFPTQEYPDDVILSFRKEVCLMKRLRHPNILLFMGVITSPHHLCIVTEFLPRGSLLRLLQRKTTKLHWRRRVHMAMDIARGMNFLHHCHPPIVHLDLRSSNLLVDKNWTVKVGDFGLSRIKHETYLTTKTRIGTPQWMAPEILRNEQANEKSDVYSYGVVLWEITTEKIPWDNLNSMQVIEAVGFMNQRLEIPEGVDPQWGSLIESCCSSEAESRPTFQEILTKLKDLQKKLAIEFQGLLRRRQKGL